MTFGILLFPGVEELDFVGPWEMVTMWSTYANGPKKCITIAKNKGEIRCAKGLGVIADYDFEDCPRLDHLLVPGGCSVFQYLGDEQLIAFLQQKKLEVNNLLSVCSGSFLLHKAGLLEGKCATTHWKVFEDFAKLDGVTASGERWVQDGTVWTSAGVSAGMDMTLAFINEVAGTDAANQVQINAEYFPSDRIYGEIHDNMKPIHYLNKLKS